MKIQKIKSRVEDIVREDQNQIHSMQESLVANTAFSIEERIALVSYLDSVKGELKEKVVNQ